MKLKNLNSYIFFYNMTNFYKIDLKEQEIRNNVILELKNIEKKLNVSFYNVNYIINELELDDELDEKDFDFKFSN